MTDAVGFALVVLEPMSVGKQVFLLAIVTIPTVMRCMTTASPTVQKAAYGREKSPAVAGKKTAACGGSIPVNKQPIPMPSPMCRSHIHTP